MRIEKPNFCFLLSNWNTTFNYFCQRFCGMLLPNRCHHVSFKQCHSVVDRSGIVLQNDCRVHEKPKRALDFFVRHKKTKSSILLGAPRIYISAPLCVPIFSRLRSREFVEGGLHSFLRGSPKIKLYADHLYQLTKIFWFIIIFIRCSTASRNVLRYENSGICLL